MQKLIILFVQLIIFIAASVQATILTIDGPSFFDGITAGHTDVGLQITSLENVTLTSFVFDSNGLDDLIILTDDTGTIVNSVSYDGAQGANPLLVDWSLTAGTTYRLLSTTDEQFDLWFNNTKHIGYSAWPTNNSHISVDGGWWQDTIDTEHWWAFTSLVTSDEEGTDPIPEPTTMLLFGTGIVGLVSSRLRKKK